jgi:transposase
VSPRLLSHLCGDPPHATPTRAGSPPATACRCNAHTPIGVGIDTARYGHYVAFLDAGLQTAAPDLEVPESSQGYARLRQRLDNLVSQHGHVHFHIRLDAAGTCADNLLAFLQGLRLDHAQFTLSCGDTQRNKNYRVAVFGHQKSDPVEARACARFALTEKPRPTAALAVQLRRLRLVAGRLQAVVRQRTRLVNQLHQLLARTFPELALLVKDITVGWCLELLCRYPTAALLAGATDSDLQGIAYLPHGRVAPLLQGARSLVASLAGLVAEELVRDQVRQVRDAQARQKRLENLLVAAYRELPEPNHLDSIPGIGAVTAAVLTAFILDIEQFRTPGQLVAYFGVLPIEASSGFERDGSPRGPRRYVMSPRGNDLVRRHLWLAALSAAQHNPACRALYARVRAKHPDQLAVAIGHVMRKLLHLAFAIWKSGRPFDPEHYPWQAPGQSVTAAGRGPQAEQAAGHTPDEPAEQVVTTTCTSTVAGQPATVEPHAAGGGVWLDFAHLKSQLTLVRVVEHLGLKLRGEGAQRRGPCPIHQGDGRGRTFSVNLQEQVYHCFAAGCGGQGDVIDLWAAVHRMSLREAALDLVRTFNLESAPSGTGTTEKRHGYGYGSVREPPIHTGAGVAERCCALPAPTETNSPVLTQDEA